MIILKCLVLGVTSVLLLFNWTSSPAAGVQAISPSSAPNTHQRNKQAVETGEGDGQLNPQEASRRILLAMESIVPFEVVGSEYEAPLQEVAKTFLTGTADEAVDKLTKIRLEKPELPPPPFMIANMLLSIGQRQQSIAWLEKAVVDFPDHPSAYLGFAQFATSENRIAEANAMLFQAQALIDKGQWSKGQEKVFRSAVLDTRTNVFVNRQQLDQAKVCLMELSTLIPENTNVIIRLAQVEFDLGNVESSFDLLSKAQVKNPALRKPEVVIADWFLRIKKSKESAEWIAKAAKKFPDDVAVQVDYGRWLLQNERIPEAREVVNRAETMGGDKYTIGYLQGQLAFAQRDYELSEFQFETLLKLKPNDADATNMLALSLIESQDSRKHGRALELAMLNQRLYPQSPAAMATLGWLYYRTGKIAEAEKALRAVIASNNLGPVPAFYVATFLSDNNDFAGAKSLLEQALSSSEYFMFRLPAEELLGLVNEKLKSSNDGSGNKSRTQPDSANDKSRR